MDTYRAVLTVVVLLAVAVFILLFEKKRAQGIERDLRDQHARGKDRERPRRPENGSRD